MMQKKEIKEKFKLGKNTLEYYINKIKENMTQNKKKLS